MSQILLPFKKVFLFEKFTKKHQNLDFLVRKIESRFEFDRSVSLLMILRNSDFGYFNILDLENFFEQGVLYSGNSQVLIDRFHQILTKRNSLIRSERRYGIKGLKEKSGYLVTDINLFDKISDDKIFRF